MPSAPASADSAAARDRMRLVVAGIILFLVVVGTFWPALNNSYVNYDDPDYLINNLPVQNGLSWADIKWAFGTTAASNWHPLTWISHMLDCQVFGPKLWGHHLTSILLHGINAVLVFLLFHRSTRSFWRSLMLAACFGLHPLRVESVVWLSERKDVLSGCLGLAALLAYVCYGQKIIFANTATTSSSGRPAYPFASSATFRYLLALLLFALSLLSKPMMVTLPCVMLLLDFWPLQRMSRSGWGRLVGEKIPFLVLSAAVCVVTFLVQRSGGAMEQMSHYGAAHHIANALVSYVRYLEKFFWPVRLAPIYPVIDQWPAWAVAGSAALIVTVTAVVLWWRTKAAYALVGWLWFLGTLVPVIGLVAVGEQAMADRYTYFTQLGVALGLIWGGELLTRSWRGRAPILGIASILLLLAGIAATRQQTKVWANSETLFRHTLAVTTNNYSAHANLSVALGEQGWFEDALVHAREAARLRPDSPETIGNLGAALARVGRFDEAIAAFREFVRLRPTLADAHRNLATALSQSGRLDEAIAEFEEAIRLEPRSAIFHQALAQALNQKGRVDEAAQHLQEAARLNAAGNPGR